MCSCYCPSTTRHHFLILLMRGSRLLNHRFPSWINLILGPLMNPLSFWCLWSFHVGYCFQVKYHVLKSLPTELNHYLYLGWLDHHRSQNHQQLPLPHPSCFQTFKNIVDLILQCCCFARLNPFQVHDNPHCHYDKAKIVETEALEPHQRLALRRS